MKSKYLRNKDNTLAGQKKHHDQIIARQKMLDEGMSGIEDFLKPAMEQAKKQGESYASRSEKMYRQSSLRDKRTKHVYKVKRSKR